MHNRPKVLLHKHQAQPGHGRVVWVHFFLIDFEFKKACGLISTNETEK